MKDSMDAKLSLKNKMSCQVCILYNCSNSSKNNLEKTLFTLPKISAPEKRG